MSFKSWASAGASAANHRRQVWNAIGDYVMPRIEGKQRFVDIAHSGFADRAAIAPNAA
jgi:hypothetical protein